MLVASRFSVPEPEGAAFLEQARAALAAFAGRPGFVRGSVGRAPDDPTAWLVTTEWEGIGAYRRSLSGYEVKLHAAPLLARARDEPSAFEVLASAGDTGPGGPGGPSGRAGDAGSTRIGEAAGPAPRDAV